MTMSGNVDTPRLLPLDGSGSRARGSSFVRALCGFALLALAGVALVSTPAGAQVLPADRATAWNPGLNAVGGIPARRIVCARLAPLGGGKDDTDAIQLAIDRCPVGQIVDLAKGTFLITGGRHLLINKGITLRGAGPQVTILAKTDGAKPFRSETSERPAPIIIVGPARWSSTGASADVASSSTLLRDAEKAAFEIEVDDPDLFKAGQIVLLDEVSGAAWQPDPLGRGKVWAAPDWRVVWQKNDPAVAYVNDFDAATFPSTPNSAGSWFSRPDRPTAEVKTVAAVTGSKVRFTTPIHISYRVAHKAQVSLYARPHVAFAGVENLGMIGGDNGNLRFQWSAYSWARNIDVQQWHGEGISIDHSLGTEVREFYVHDGAWSQPGGGGYAISLSGASSEVLIENGIAVRANKLLVARSAGAGSVVGYNYMDMSYINTQGSWIEVGLNASHMVGPHHVLFEGNLAHNADSDKTHGNSVYLTFFRNHLRCARAPFENQAGGRIDDATQAANGPKRCAGLMAYSYWMSFLGNVLGTSGQIRGWSAETTFKSGRPGVWMLGWDDVEPYRVDARVAETVLRHGNFDYVSNAVGWDAAIAERNLPASLYLMQRPRFFGSETSYVWPWVEPTGALKVHRLPAKVRYDAGTPFAEP